MIAILIFMMAIFIIGMVIGAALGITLGAALNAASKADHKAEPEPTKERTKLLTVGSLVKWNGDVYEIEQFKTDQDNQTIAYIGDERLALWVPIEELEAVEE